MAGSELPEEHDSLKGSLRGERALAKLGPLTTPRRTGSYRRVLTTTFLGDCDCYTGTVLRVCIDRHLAEDKKNEAQIWEPKEQMVWSRLHDFLTPLPQRCDLVGDEVAPARNEDIVIRHANREHRDSRAARTYDHACEVSTWGRGFSCESCRAGAGGACGEFAPACNGPRGSA